MSDVVWGYSILDSCNGCGACMSICPTRAVSGGPGRVHSIDPNLCIQCGACARVCPNSCIEDSSGNVAQRLGKRFWEIPHFDEAKCRRCGSCVGMCPPGILALSNDAPRMPVVSNPRLCSSCRMCSKVCVFGAVEFFPAARGSDMLFDVHDAVHDEGDR